MPPLALLARPEWSTGRKIAMLAMDGYLLVVGDPADRQGRAARGRLSAPMPPRRIIDLRDRSLHPSRARRGWSDHARFEAMREVEVAACEEMDGPTAEELEAIRARDASPSRRSTSARR